LIITIFWATLYVQLLFEYTISAPVTKLRLQCARSVAEFLKTSVNIGHVRRHADRMQQFQRFSAKLFNTATSYLHCLAASL